MDPNLFPRHQLPVRGRSVYLYVQIMCRTDRLAQFHSNHVHIKSLHTYALLGRSIAE